MSEDIPANRPRKSRRAKMQFAVEATVWTPGQREPRKFGALWVRRETGAVVFGLPEFERPYMQRSLRIPDSSGAIVEIAELVQQQQPVPQWAPTVTQPTGPPPLQIEHPGPSAETAVVAAFGNRPLRSRIDNGASPVSEAVDEAGNPIIVRAAFGMPVL